MSKIVTLVKGEPMTTTLALAEGTDNDHASVIKLVREYQGDLREFGLLDFKSESSGGRPIQYAILNEQQATLLMTYMRNSDIVRAFKKRLVKAFHEMANRNPVEHLSRVDLLRMALESEEKRIALESSVKELKPKVEALDRIATSNGSMCISDAAKSLQMRPKELFAMLSDLKWIFRRGGKRWVAYGTALAAGVLEHKVTPVPLRNGSEMSVPQPLVTPKGLTKLAEKLSAKPQAA